MYYYKVLSTLSIPNGDSFLTYSFKDLLQNGQVVKVPFGKKTAYAVVYKKTKKPDFDTKDILKTYDFLINEKLIKTMLIMANYYQAPINQCVKLVLSKDLDKKRRNTKKENHSLKEKDIKDLLLSDQQLEAIDKIKKSQKNTTILHGITGSGKTNVYIKLISEQLKNNKSALLIVPEIALTTQLEDTLKEYFKDQVLTYHSSHTEAMKFKIWEKIVTSKTPLIILGARSSLFLPVNNLGIIIIDEFHEPSLKQEANPKYQTQRVAAILAKENNIKLILGSATPSIVDYHLAKTGAGQIIEMTKKASESFKKPSIEVIDMRKKDNHSQIPYLSPNLLNSIDQSLKNDEQVLLYLNRKGSATITLCKNCGWTHLCSHCHIPTVLYIDKNKLLCNICGRSYKIPTSCPECKSVEIFHRGVGTRMLESDLKALYPNKKIARFDSDNNLTDSLHKRYHDLKTGKIDIIIGTQIVAKGLNLPRLSTLGIVQADSGLKLPDFSTNERVFQLITQAIGRVGRTNKDSRIILQTYDPSNEIIKFASQSDYLNFYQEEIMNRKKLGFPPFRFLLKITTNYKTEKATIFNIKKLKKLILDLNLNVDIFGPAPEFYELIGGKYHWQIIIKAKNRKDLLTIIQHLPTNSAISYNLDPMSLLY